MSFLTAVFEVVISRVNLIELSAVTKNGRTIADEQEVKRAGNHDKVGGIVGADNATAPVLEVELAGARDVHVSGRLVASRVEAEGDHVGSRVVRGRNVVAAVGVRSVRMEEGSGHLLVDVNAVSSDAELLNSGGVPADVDQRSLETAEGANSLSCCCNGSMHAIRVCTHRIGGDGGSTEEGCPCRGGVSDGIILSELSSSSSNGGECWFTRKRKDVVHRSGVNSATDNTIKRSSSRGSLREPVPRLQRIIDTVSSRLHGNEHSLNGPLHLIEKNVGIVLVHTSGLHAVHADQGKSDALDEDIMNLRVDEDVVNEQTALGDLKVGDSTSILSISTSRRNLLNEVRRLGESDVQETLTVGDRYGRNRQARVLVEPEQQGDHELKGLMRTLTGLVTVHDAKFDTLVGLGVGHLLKVSLAGGLLSYEPVPTGFLVGLDDELAVKVVDIPSVLIQRVTVNIKLNALHNALAGVVAVPNNILVGCSLI